MIVEALVIIILPFGVCIEFVYGLKNIVHLCTNNNVVFGSRCGFIEAGDLFCSNPEYFRLDIFFTDLYLCHDQLRKTRLGLPQRKNAKSIPRLIHLGYAG